MNLSNANLLIENELLENNDAIALTNCMDNLIERNKVFSNNDGICRYFKTQYYLFKKLLT